MLGKGITVGSLAAVRKGTNDDGTWSRGWSLMNINQAIKVRDQ